MLVLITVDSRVDLIIKQLSDDNVTIHVPKLVATKSELQIFESIR